MFARASSSSKARPRWVSFSATLTRSRSAAMRSRISLYAPTTARVSASFVDALAEQRRVREEPLVVEPAEDDDRVVERLAGDEPRRSEAHPVLAHDALESRALRGREDDLPQHRGDSNPLSAPPRRAVRAGTARRGGDGGARRRSSHTIRTTRTTRGAPRPRAPGMAVPARPIDDAGAGGPEAPPAQRAARAGAGRARAPSR